MPWRLPAVERALIGRAARPELWSAAAAHAAEGAKPLTDNAFKVELVNASSRASSRRWRGCRDVPAAAHHACRRGARGARRRAAQGDGHGAVRRRQSGARLRPRRAGVQHRRHGFRGPHRHHHGRTSSRTSCACSPTSPTSRCPTTSSGVVLRAALAVVVAETLEAAAHAATLGRRCATRRGAQLTDIDAPQAIPKPEPRPRLLAR